MRQLRQHGLVFITDIPRLEDALEKIAKRMGPMKDTFYGYTWDGKIFRTSTEALSWTWCHSIATNAGI